MKNRLRNKFTLLMLLIIGCLVSCTQRDLTAPSGEGNVNLSFDWSRLQVGDNIPTGMKLYFYGTNGKVIEKDGSSDMQSLSLPEDTYKLLVCNEGASNVKYSDMDNYDSAKVIVTPVTKSSAILLPAYVYVAALQNVEIQSDGSINASVVPYSLIKKANVKMTVTGNLDAVNSTSCYIDGIADSAMIATGEVKGTTAQVPFTPTSSTGGYESVIPLLGLASSASSHLNIAFQFKNGGFQIVNVDITSALAKLDKTTYSVDVSLSINVTGSIATGFSATLTDWNVVDKNANVQ